VTIITGSTDAPGWLGAENGLFRVINGETELVPASDNVGISRVSDIITDNSGYPEWVKAENGLFRVIDEKTKYVAAHDAVDTGLIGDVLTDKTGELTWVGADNGLFRVVEGKTQHVPAADDIDAKAVRQIYPDSLGQPVWISAYNGLFRITTGKTKLIRTVSELKYSWPHYLLTDDSGTPTWIGTRNGLFQYTSTEVTLAKPSSFRSPKGALQPEGREPFLVLADVSHPCAAEVDVEVRLRSTERGGFTSAWEPAGQLSVESADTGLQMALTGKRAAFFDPGKDTWLTELAEGNYRFEARATVAGLDGEVIAPIGEDFRLGAGPLIRFFQKTWANVYGQSAILILGLLAVLRLAGWLVYRMAPLWFLKAASELSSAATIKLQHVTLSISWLIGAGLRHSPRVLDAWIADNRTKITSAYHGKDAVVSAARYIPLPVGIGGAGHTQGVQAPLESFLRKQFAARIPRLSVTGTGGSGKTALATWIGDRCLEEEASNRPGPHVRIPVLLDHNLDAEVSLTDRVQKILRDDYRVGWLDRPLVEALLKSGRILLILDRLSELDRATQERLRPGHAEFPEAAFIATSRVRPRLDGTTVEELTPQLLSGEALTKFVQSYRGKAGWTDAEVHDVSGRISRFFGQKPATILLVKMAIEAELERGAEALTTRSDLFRDYIRTLDIPIDASSRPTEYTWPKPLDDAMAVAAAIVGDSFHVNEISRTAANAALSAPSTPSGEDADTGTSDNADERLMFLVSRLQVFEWRGAETRIAPVLDPVVEHLAALHALETHPAGDTAYWSKLARKASDMTEAWQGPVDESAFHGYLDTLRLLAFEASPAHPAAVSLTGILDPKDRAA